MKRGHCAFLCVALVLCALFHARAGMDTEGFLSSLSDWIIGTDWGIRSGKIDEEKKNLTLTLPRGDLDALTGQDRDDIESALMDMLSLYLSSGEEAARFSILYEADGGGLPPGEQSAGETAVLPDREGQAEMNLVFIHHSCGENWLRDGLAQMLNDQGIHVADITYGWREYGDHTDTADWPGWFRDDVMGLVYRELGTMSAENSLAAKDGENTAVLFKSCFPNSDVGDAIGDEQAVYNSLLAYFESRPDKMFILVTPPPTIRIGDPGLTRELCLWLTDRGEGWLGGRDLGNVFVFDLYNVLTHPDAHHRMESGQEVHTRVPGADTLFYDSAGDDHPNGQGNRKAAEEFVPLLLHWLDLFIGDGGGEPQLFIP